jgi:hypothetical protein
LLKWKFQAGRRGNSWRRTIWEQRDVLTDILKSSPSLQSYLLHATHAAYIGATVAASEETGLAIGIFPEECPFSSIEMLDMEFFPEDPQNE